MHIRSSLYEDIGGTWAFSAQHLNVGNNHQLQIEALGFAGCISGNESDRPRECQLEDRAATTRRPDEIDQLEYALPFPSHPRSRSCSVPNAPSRSPAFLVLGGLVGIREKVKCSLRCAAECILLASRQRSDKALEDSLTRVEPMPLIAGAAGLKCLGSCGLVRDLAKPERTRPWTHPGRHGSKR